MFSQLLKRVIGVLLIIVILPNLALAQAPDVRSSEFIYPRKGNDLGQKNVVVIFFDGVSKRTVDEILEQTIRFYRETSNDQFQPNFVGMFGPVTTNAIPTYSQILNLLLSAGFRPNRFDSNNDQEVDDKDLVVLAIENTTGGGQNSGACADPPSKWCTKIGRASQNDRVAVAHELGHAMLDADDIYGDTRTGRNDRYSLMGSSHFEYAHFDPWHKLRFGWFIKQRQND